MAIETTGTPIISFTAGAALRGTVRRKLFAIATELLIELGIVMTVSEDRGLLNSAFRLEFTGGSGRARVHAATVVNEWLAKFYD